MTGRLSDQKRGVILGDAIYGNTPAEFARCVTERNELAESLKQSRITVKECGETIAGLQAEVARLTVQVERVRQLAAHWQQCREWSEPDGERDHTPPDAAIDVLAALDALGTETGGKPYERVTPEGRTR